MNIIKFFLVLIFFHPNLLIGQGKTYTKQEVKEDLTFLQYLLDERHPNIGIYATKEELNAFFDHISISDSLSELEVYTILASTNKIKMDTLYFILTKICLNEIMILVSFYQFNHFGMVINCI